MARSEPESESEQRELESRLFELLREMLIELHPAASLPPIHRDSSLQDELGIDSLARAELMSRVESAFGIRLQDQALVSAERVRDVLSVIRSAPSTQPLKSSKEKSANEKSAMDTFLLRRTIRPEIHAFRSPENARTLIDVLEWRAQAGSQQTWVHFHTESDQLEQLSYGELWAKSKEVAAGLRRLDLPVRPIVGIMLPTCLEFFYCFYGILMAGGVAVPLYPPDRPSRLEEHLRRQIRILENSEANLLIASREILPLRSILKPSLSRLTDVLEPEKIMALGRENKGTPDRVALHDDDLAFLQYTSGSTGDPKGVMLTHRNLLSNLRAIGEAIHPAPTDVFVSWLPLYHDMGLIGAGMGTLYFGVPLALMSPLSFIARPERWLWMIHKYRATLSAAPNFAYELCSRKIQDSQISGLDLSSWRAAYNGAEPVRAGTLERFADRFKAYGFRREALTPLYGLAESSVGLTIPPLGRGPVIDFIKRDSFLKEDQAIPTSADDPLADQVVGCGVPLHRHEIRVVDFTGREVRDREIGKIQFRGPSSTSGYYRNAEATRALIQEDATGRWLETGDLGYLVRGEVFVTGRVKDLIIRGGRHIFPYELEEKIGGLPGIRRGGVAVFGKGDPKSGTEELIVLAELRWKGADEQALRAEIRDRVMAIVGLPPDDIVLAPAHAVLKTPSGKIRRKDCLKLYEQGALGKTSSVPVQWFKLRVSSLRPEFFRILRQLKIVVYGSYFYTVAAILTVPGVLGIVLLPKLSWRVAVCRTLLGWIWALTGISVEVSDLENAKDEQARILVANHASYTDVFVLSSVLPGTFRFVTKNEFQKTPVLGWLIARLGGLFVERFDPASATRDTDEIIQAVRRGDRIVVFPEGTFTRAPGLKSFRLGAFWVAARTGVPVLPVTLRGTRSLLRDGWRFVRRNPVGVRISSPFSAEGTSWKDAIQLRDQVRAEMLKRCGEPDLGQ